jgi:hypothetical protein
MTLAIMSPSTLLSVSISISISLTTLLKGLFTMFSRKPREPGVVDPELQQDQEDTLSLPL